MNNQYIQDYFSLTGRPISTMTVEEYIAFQTMPCIGNMIQPQSDFIPQITLSDTKSEDSVLSPQNITNITHAHKKESSEQSKNPDDKINNAMRMLKSVKG